MRENLDFDFNQTICYSEPAGCSSFRLIGPISFSLSFTCFFYVSVLVCNAVSAISSRNAKRQCICREHFRG